MALAADTRSILIVEDDQGIAEFMIWALEDHGFEVYHAHTLGEGLNLFEERVPDLVVADLMLPDGYGIEVIRRAKRLAGANTVPGVVISAHPKANAYARSAGADACLSKPFDLDEFFQTLDGLLTSVDQNGA